MNCLSTKETRVRRHHYRVNLRDLPKKSVYLAGAACAGSVLRCMSHADATPSSTANIPATWISARSHMHDIPLSLDTVDAASGRTGAPGAQRMEEIMSGMRIQFARAGDPNHAGLPHWRPYTLQDRATMCFDLPPRLVNDPRGKERRLVERVPYTQRGT